MIGIPDFQNMDQMNRDLRLHAGSAVAYVTQLITVVAFLAVYIALDSFNEPLVVLESTPSRVSHFGTCSLSPEMQWCMYCKVTEHCMASGL
jgi:hypothetical protein